MNTCNETNGIDNLIFDKALHMVGDDADFAKLSNKLSYYSPFEALGVSDYEIRHGNFLAHLFNPTGSHGFGEAVLKVFLKRLFANINQKEKVATVVLGDIGEILVRREWHDIDILIELKDHKLKAIIVIELKLHASESGKQLQKYHSFIEGREEYSDHQRIYVYMTPQGAISTHEQWIGFNMMEEFIQQLKQLAQGTTGDQLARDMLADYVRIMEQKFMTDEELETLAERLWARYPDVLSFLTDKRPDQLSKVFDQLSELKSETTKKALGELGFDFSREWEYKTSSQLLYTFPNWDGYNGMCTSSDKRLSKSKRILMLEIFKYSDGIIARFVIGLGDTQARRNLLQTIIDGNADKGRQSSVEAMTDNYTRLGSQWLVKANDIDPEQSIELLTRKATQKLEGFLKKQLPLLDKAILAGC